MPRSIRSRAGCGLGIGNHGGMSEGQAGARHGRLLTGRLDAFSDGVFAIAITLLVLEISVPAGSEDDLLGAVGDQWRSYLAYIVSFSTIGALWLAHSAITRYLAGTNALLIRINLLLLLVVSFLPFPTGLLAQYSEPDDAARVATTMYGLAIFAAAGLTAVMWRYALYAGLVDAAASGDELDALTKQITPGLAGYLAMIALGLFLPTAAVFGYLLLALYLIVPFGLIKATRAKL